MAEGYEIIDGKRFWVKRDDEGVEYSRAAADIAPAPKPPRPIVERVRIITRGYRPVDGLTQRQRDELLVFLVRAELRELRDE